MIARDNREEPGVGDEAAHRQERDVLPNTGRCGGQLGLREGDLMADQRAHVAHEIPEQVAERPFILALLHDCSSEHAEHWTVARVEAATA